MHYVQHPLSLQSIVTNLMGGVYPTMKAFDMEMSRLFEKARRFYPRVTAPYGAVLTAQVRT
jgi:chromatin structure-remodeling complex subunit RSC1/2